MNMNHFKVLNELKDYDLNIMIVLREEDLKQ